MTSVQERERGGPSHAGTRGITANPRYTAILNALQDLFGVNAARRKGEKRKQKGGGGGEGEMEEGKLLRGGRQKGGEICGYASAT